MILDGRKSKRIVGSPHKSVTVLLRRGWDVDLDVSKERLSSTLLDKSFIFIFNVLHLVGVQKSLIFSNHRSRNFHYQ